jgi:hypothetical protein
MTSVSFDDDLDWEFAFDSRLGHPAGNPGPRLRNFAKKTAQRTEALEGYLWTA